MSLRSVRLNTLFLVLLTSFLVACSTFNGGSSSDAAPKPDKKLFKGTWQVTGIRFVGDPGIYKAYLFDRADSACFKGSEWVFIPNNGAGRYTLTGTGSQCTPSSNRIHWSLYKPETGAYQFQFKYVDEKDKPLDAGNRGYRAGIETLTDGAITLRVPTEYQGKPFDVLMSFTRISSELTL